MDDRRQIEIDKIKAERWRRTRAALREVMDTPAGRTVMAWLI
jgi:hypothetical protein